MDHIKSEGYKPKKNPILKSLNKINLIVIEASSLKDAFENIKCKSETNKKVALYDLYWYLYCVYVK